jgi:cell division septation protein DedD
MNTTIRAGWLAAAFVLAAGWLSAQKTTREDLQRADRQFDLYAYNLAMQTYEQVLKNEPRNAHALARVGDCHYQLNHPEKALDWYQRALRQTDVSSEVLLRYGKALMQTGDYDGAEAQFKLYADENETVGRHYAEMCEYAIKTAKKESQYVVKNEALNTEFADFGPALYLTRLVFNSSRTDLAQKKDPKGASEWSGGSYNHLYVSQRSPENGQLQKPAFLRSDFERAPQNEGPVAFSADGRRVVFCRNNFVNGTRQIATKGVNMSLYVADVDNGKWKNIKPFAYNGSDYATGFPSLSPDGNTLVFASTQPGGFGGWDIYVSNYTASGWSTPRNLGSPLNTAGNEVTPFFDGKNLYFSSDWHRGLGGLDVFRAELGREEVSNVYHLGPGINSPRDDYGFVFDSGENLGYLTSTRNGGRGNEDIWQVARKWSDETTDTGRKPNRMADPLSDEPARPNQYNDESEKTTGYGRLHILVTDKQGNPLPDVDVDFSDCYIGKGITGGDGKFYFDELIRTLDCTASLSKNGYRQANIPLQSFGRQNVRISMSPERREEFTGRVLDSRSRAPLSNVNIQVSANERIIETNTDADGLYSLYLEPGTSYLITYARYDYTDEIVKTYIDYDSRRIENVLMEKTYVNNNSNTANNTNAQRPNSYNYDDYSDAGSSGSTTKRIYKREEAPKVEQPALFNGYSIQLAAMPEEPTDAKLRSYESLTKIANIYVKSENNLNKIRLGIFPTKSEAEEGLKKIAKNPSAKGAFVVEERGADQSLVLGESLSPVQHSTEPPQKTTKGNAGVRYAVQLGSFSSEQSISIGDYAKLSGLGNIYTKAENGTTKVRVGVWGNHPEAESAKAEALKKGFNDAIIITEQVDDPTIKDFLLSTPQSPAQYSTTEQKARAGAEKGPRPNEYSAAVSYPFHVRIAALANPERFDSSSLEDLGYIEQRKSESNSAMTVILLSGYPDLKSASAALEKVRERGYDEAYVVKEEKGKLVRK